MYYFEEAIDVELDESAYSEPYVDVEQGFMRSGDKLYYVGVGSDSDVENPFEEDEDVVIATFHPHYKNNSEFGSMDELREYISENGGRIYPVEAYIHSGIALALRDEGNFPDRQWDVTPTFGAILLKQSYLDQMHDSSPSRMEEIARQIAETYGEYLNGSAYGYVVKEIDEKTGEELSEDSCWGFIGDDVKEGIKEATYYAEEQVFDFVVSGYDTTPNPEHPDEPVYESFSAHLGAAFKGTPAEAAGEFRTRLHDFLKSQVAYNEGVFEDCAAAERAPGLADGDRRTLHFGFIAPQGGDKPTHSYTIVNNSYPIDNIPERYSNKFKAAVNNEVREMRDSAPEIESLSDRHAQLVQADVREFSYQSIDAQWAKAQNADKQTLAPSGSSMKLG